MKNRLYDFVFYLDCKFDGVDYTTRRKPKWLQNILWKLREMIKEKRKETWKVLWFLHINHFVSENMCRLNIYSKFSMGGRCMWCGVVHGKHWKIEKPNYGGLLSERKEEE